MNKSGKDRGSLSSSKEKKISKKIVKEGNNSDNSLDADRNNEEIGISDNKSHDDGGDGSTLSSDIQLDKSHLLDSAVDDLIVELNENMLDLNEKIIPIKELAKEFSFLLDLEKIEK